jgi:hypothetical protein
VRVEAVRLAAGARGTRKGHSFFGFFILRVIFFPAALVVAYMVSDRTGWPV